MIRKPKIKDVKQIHRLLKLFGERGELLPRPLSELYDHLRDFSVFTDDNDSVIGCCALQFCWEDLAEIRSLAVHPDYQRKKIGSRLIETVISEAKLFNIKRIFTLTYRPDFFRKYGFEQIDRSELPLKVWSDCLLCVKFPDCDEIAMMKDIS
jgi:amino-acid N-acetyltransferase